MHSSLQCEHTHMLSLSHIMYISKILSLFGIHARSVYVFVLCDSQYQENINDVPRGYLFAFSTAFSEYLMIISMVVWSSSGISKYRAKVS